MEISFKTKRLMKVCNDWNKTIRHFGEKQGKILRRRLDDLRAADNLEVMRAPGLGRPEELTQNRKGQISLMLDGPNRLILKPDHSPLPCKDDGGLDWKKVTAVTIIEIVDYHGR